MISKYRLWAAASILVLAGCSMEIYGRGAQYDPSAEHPIDVVMPANAPFISQQFAPRVRDGQGGHYGIDIWQKIGTPVLAAAPGRVVASYYEGMYGNRIIIRHGKDASGRVMTSVYKHLDARMVEEGAVVSRGQQIGTLGESGLLSALPHLHFETRQSVRSESDTPIDPHMYWLGGIGKVTCFTPGLEVPDAPFRITYPVVCK